MNTLERQVQIYLLATPGVGRQTFRQVEQHLRLSGQSWEEWWTDPGGGERVGLNDAQQISLKKFRERFSLGGYAEYLAGAGIRVISFEDIEYPELLKQIDDRPFFLYIKGPSLPRGQPQISVVGTRKITPYGRLATKKIVTELVERQCVIVSGFMYGVDFAAHQAALDGGGATVGVLGFGFEHFFPSLYRQKFQELLDRGMTFMTEYAPFVRPTHGSFPERNRIVAGMSLGTVVVEAGVESGTMITSRLAGDYGRGVFAVPGSIFSPFSEGTRALVNQGACLVGSGREVLEELGVATAPRMGLLDAVGSGPERLAPPIHPDIIEELRLGSLDFSGLQKITGLSTAELSSTLSLLEISDQIVRVGEVWSVKI